MALDHTRPAQQFVNYLKTQNAEITGSVETTLLNNYKEMYKAMIDEMVANGVITVNVVVPATPFSGSATGGIS